MSTTPVKVNLITPSEFRGNADSFTKGYLTTALWSTSAELGKCDDPDCGADDPTRVLVDDVTERCITCGGKVSGADRSFQDLQFDVEDCSGELLAQIVFDCAQFQVEMAKHITEDNLLRSPDDDTDGAYGHDFWLTRNGHGCGFWDGDYADPAATALDKCAKRFGEFHLYLGDDGKIYGEGTTK